MIIRRNTFRDICFFCGSKLSCLPIEKGEDDLITRPSVTFHFTADTVEPALHPRSLYFGTNKWWAIYYVKTSLVRPSQAHKVSTSAFQINPAIRSPKTNASKKFRVKRNFKTRCGFEVWFFIAFNCYFCCCLVSRGKLLPCFGPCCFLIGKIR